MESSFPSRSRRRRLVVRVLLAWLVVGVAAAALVLVRRAGQEADLALAAERLAAGDVAEAGRLLAAHRQARARAGRTLAQALQGGAPDACDCSPADLAFFRPVPIVEDAIRRGEPEAALRVAEVVRRSGDAAGGVLVAAALVEAGRDDEARAALATAPEPDRLAGPGREAARVLELRARGAAHIVRDRRRRPAGTLDAAGSFRPEADAATLVPAAAADLAAAETGPPARDRPRAQPPGPGGARAPSGLRRDPLASV